jgi:hypothetical protein
MKQHALLYISLGIGLVSGALQFASYNWRLWLQGAEARDGAKQHGACLSHPTQPAGRVRPNRGSGNSVAQNR